MKLFFKRLFFRPIYRVDIIDWAIKHHKNYIGVCRALCEGLKHAGIKKYKYLSSNGDTYWIGLTISDSFRIFPAHNYYNAHHLFNARSLSYEHPNNYLWWTSCDWNGSRMDYLKWLREQYADDKTPIKNIL